MSALFGHFSDDAESCFDPEKLIAGVDLGQPEALEAQIASRRGEVESRLVEQSQGVMERGAEVRNQAAHQLDPTQPVSLGGEAGAQQASGTKDDPQQCTPYPSEGAGHAPLEAQGTNAAELRVELEQTISREIVELEQSLAAARCNLEARVQAQLAALDAAGSGDTAALDRASVTRDGELEQQATRELRELSSANSAHRTELTQSRERETAELARQAQTDSSRVSTEAHTQQTSITQTLDAQVAQARGARTTEATAARNTGRQEGTAALTAASQRASQLTGSEAAMVTTQGAARNAQAIASAETRARQIEAQADGVIASTEARRRAQNQTLTQHDTAHTQSIDQRTQSTTQRLQASQQATGTALDSTQRQADEQMQAQRRSVSGAETRERSGLAGDLTRRRAQVIGERDRAMAQLQTEHNHRLAAARSRAEDTRRRIARGGRDVNALRRMVTGAMRSIDDQSNQSDRNLSQRVDQSDQAIQRQVQQHVAALHTRARRAMTTLDALARNARTRISATRNQAQRQLGQQTSAGERELNRLSAQAILQSHRDADVGVRELRRDGTAAARENARGQRAEDRSLAQMHRSQENLGPELRTEMVQTAVHDAQSSLGNVDAAHANQAMNTLNSLPENLRGQAVDNLDGPSFERLIAQVPEGRREEMDSLYRATQSPDRRLRLWREVHVSRSARELNAAMTATNADATLTPAERIRRNQATQRILDSTRQEASEETAHLQAQWRRRGQRPGLSDVAALDARKSLEHQIELRYNVNLTSDLDANRGSRDGSHRPSTRATFSTDELHSIDSGLSRLPADHILGNRMLPPQTLADGSSDSRAPGLEIHRSRMRRDFENGRWRDLPNVGGDHLDGVVNIFDAGVNYDYRHTGETDALANHNAGGPIGSGPVTRLEETIVHEVGHDVEDASGANGTSMQSNPGSVSARFRAASGWSATSMTRQQAHDAMVAQHMSEAQIEAELRQMDHTRGQYDQYESPRTATGDQVYEVDPYNRGGYISRARNNVPEHDPHWTYARSNPADNFAEQYATAVHTPALYYQDMVAGPADLRTQAQSDITAATTALGSATTDAERQRAQLQLTTANESLRKVNALQTARRTQFDIMRNDVFHSDTATAGAQGTLATVPVSSGHEAQRQTRIAQFQTAAAQAVTPQQIEALRAAAERDIRSY